MNEEPLHMRYSWREWLAIIFVFALVAAAVLSLAGCSDGDDDRRTILPTVPMPDLEAALTCHDWNGVRPDRQVQPARAMNRPDYCFVGEECFYGCPR